MKKSKFEPSKYVNGYIAEHYDRHNTQLPRGLLAELKAHAAARGESVNALICRAVTEQMKRDQAEDARRTAEPPTVTASEPETAEAEQSRPTSDGQQTAAKAPEDNSLAEITPTDSTAEPEQDSRTTTAPKSTHRGRRKQTELDAGQLTLDDPTDSDSGNE